MKRLGTGMMKKLENKDRQLLILGGKLKQEVL